MWNELYKKLDIKPAAGKAFPKPTDKDIGAVEYKRKVKLPDSYKEYAKTFGAGDLGDYFRIKVPGGAKPSVDLEAFNKLVHGMDEDNIEMYEDEALIKRMIPFASTVGGDVIAWDPKTPTDKAANEYPVIMLPDGKDKVVKLAKDFKSFVEEVALGPGFGKALKLKDWQPKRQFLAYGSDTKGL